MEWSAEMEEIVFLEDEDKDKEQDQALTDRIALNGAEHSIRLLVADVIRVAYRPLRPADVLETINCLRHLQVLDL